MRVSDVQRWRILLRVISHSSHLGLPNQIDRSLTRPLVEFMSGPGTIGRGPYRGLGYKIAELQAMKSELQRLVRHCRGDQRPDCPILESLAKNET
jgi:hypothetical protein